MIHHNWKKDYIQHDGTRFSDSKAAFKAYYSCLVDSKSTEQNGSREFPYSSQYVRNSTSAIIASNGYHNISFHNGQITGQNMHTTRVDVTLTGAGPNMNNATNAGFKDVCLENIVAPGYIRLNFTNCMILNISTVWGMSTAAFSVIKNKYIHFASTESRNTYIDMPTISLNSNSPARTNQSIFKRCRFQILQADLDRLKSRYIGFDDCLLKIGNESEYTLLQPKDTNGNIIGNPTEVEYRNEFVARCNAQSLTVPPVSDFDITLPMGRWVFANGDTSEGIVLQGSIFEAFESRHFLKLGHDDDARMPQIQIVSAKNVPCTITQDNADSKLSVQDNSISVSSGVDITKMHTMRADSKIIPFGSKCELNQFKILDNLPAKYGLWVDSTPNLHTSNTIANGNIEADEFYMIRSASNEYASVIYNGVEYSTSLASRNNILKGIEGLNSFVVQNGNPVLYKVSDLALQRTIQIRIVDNIPSQQITSGALLPDYWYLIEHDTDQSNTTDYVTYNGVKYSAKDSFRVVPGVTSFTKNGSIHLRRCWHKDFDFATESTDKVFWNNKQKPRWIDVSPDYLMCLMKNNSGSELEMQDDGNGNYIASGYNGFYDMVLGTGSIPIPEYPIKGAYLQLRIILTTLNPM